MKRLLKQSRLKKRNNLSKLSRLRRKILADWTQVDPHDSNIIEYLTEAITYNYPVQINYQGSGWRNIFPYGFNTSQPSNSGDGGQKTLLMCYKDSGEIRSYRLDRIDDIYIDFQNQVSTNNNDEMNEDLQMQNNNMNSEQDTIDNNDMPTLPEENENLQNENINEPYDLTMLDEDNTDINDNITMNIVPDENIEDNSFNQIENNEEQNNNEHENNNQNNEYNNI